MNIHIEVLFESKFEFPCDEGPETFITVAVAG